MSARLYDLLVARGQSAHPILRVLLGLNWCVCEIEGVGLCFSPADVPRTLTWSGSVAQSPASQVTPWIRSFDAAQAAVGVAAVNACINLPDNPLLRRAELLTGSAPAHLRVFAHFADQLKGASVTVVGRYPGLERLWSDVRYRCLERRLSPGVLPDSAAEYVLPESDWVFVTGSAIANKTLPRLLELSRRARVVLMGPSVPWLAEWADFGVNYLAGVSVRDESALFQTAAEGGGTRIFETAVDYRLLAF